MFDEIQITPATIKAIQEGLALAFYGDYYQLTIRCVFEGMEVPVRVIMVPDDIPVAPKTPNLKVIPPKEKN